MIDGLRSAALDSATRSGFAIIVGLALSAVAVVLIVVVLGAPILAGLALLALLDVTIIAWGYARVRGTFRQAADQNQPAARDADVR